MSVAPLDFSDTEGLRRSMQGAGVLYNTYWVPFGRGRTTFEQAVENSRVLFEAAVQAGVGRVVHFSVANASTESVLPYFRGKGQVEEMLKDTGLPYAIIRPTLVFAEGDLLLNNMAWALRRLPVFTVFGNGDYQVQPVYAEDLAAQAVDAGSGRDSFVADAPGPETFTFEELVRLLTLAVGARVRLVHIAPSLGFALPRLCRCSTIMSVAKWSGKMSSHGRSDIDAEGADETSGAQQRSGRSGGGMSGGRGPGSERTPHEAYSGGL